MIALIDSDIVAFRCAASAENELEDVAILRVDKLMRQLLEETKSDSYLSFLTGSENFRYKINPEYKANRKDKPRPKYLNACREYLVTEYHSQITCGYEADDALGIHQQDEGKTIICSVDKDLLQVSGLHYNWVYGNGEFKEVSNLEGLQRFYKQLLIGDTSDNLFGVSGIGPKKAAKIIDSIYDELEMFNAVKELYDDEERLMMNAQCMYIKRSEDDKYRIPELK